MTARLPRGAALGAGLLGALIPLGLIWIPPLRHYHVPAVTMSSATAHSVMQSMNPAACGEFAQFDILPLGLPALADAQAPIDSATRRLLDSLDRGVLSLPFGVRLPFDATFSAADLAQPDTYLKLNVAGLAVPKALIWAWQRTGDRIWLLRAPRSVDSWWAVERHTVLPRDLQWNDHAIAARAMTLSRYLCAMRSQPTFTDSAAADVLVMLATSGERLTKPASFTFRTNHGVMQNIALLDIAASFPQMPQSARFADTARARLDAQLPYFLGPEGVVFEHSAHYHLWGTALVHMVIRFYEALGIPVSADLSRRYASAVDFSRQLLRLDGSLPSWGNSFRGTRGSEVPPELAEILDTTQDRQRLMRSRASATWAPTSGVATWWAFGSSAAQRGSVASQTLVSWADFATQAHKHADDMSVLAWTSRSDLFIASGYWPNDSPEYEDAYGWAGSNAPHFVGESEDVSPVASSSAVRPRGRTLVLGSASSSALEFLDLERTAADGGRLRRQVLFARPDIWIVVDAASGASAREFETSWLLDPALSPKPAASDGSFTLETPSGPVAQVDLAGCAGGSLHVERGSRSPFSGWTAADGVVTPATALRRRCPTGGHATMVLRATPAISGDSARSPALRVEYESAEHWRVRRASTGDVVVGREGTRLVTTPQDATACRGDCAGVAIRPDSGSNQARARIDSLYFAMQSRYTPFHDLLPLRVRLTQAIIVLWIAQLVVALGAVALSRRRFTHLVTIVSALSIVGWVVVAMWLRVAYLR